MEKMEPDEMSQVKGGIWVQDENGNWIWIDTWDLGGNKNSSVILVR